MPRVRLQVHINPGELLTTVRFIALDQSPIWQLSVIDTGAATSLFPLILLNQIQYRLTQKGRVQIQQAGIARQSFEAVEAMTTIQLEDGFGSQTSSIEIRAWFAETGQALIGFDGVLDRAVLHADLKNGRDAWIEID